MSASTCRLETRAAPRKALSSTITSICNSIHDKCRRHCSLSIRSSSESKSLCLAISLKRKMSSSRESSREHKKVLRFANESPGSPDSDGGSGKGKYGATAKYDRKILNKRLELEEWMHNQLKKLYACEGEEEYNVEINIDTLLNVENKAKRNKMLQELLRGSKTSNETFIDDLLHRIDRLDAAHSQKP